MIFQVPAIDAISRIKYNIMKEVDMWENEYWEKLVS